jgi:hypothetical protein
MNVARIRTITITIPVDDEGQHAGYGAISVQEGEAICPHLCWDEALGQIVNLIHPQLGDPKYRMFQPDALVSYMERYAPKKPAPVLALPFIKFEELPQ